MRTACENNREVLKGKRILNTNPFCTIKLGQEYSALYSICRTLK